MSLQASGAQQRTFLKDMLPDEALHSCQGLAPPFIQVVLAQLNRDCPAPRHCQKILGVLPRFQSWPVSHGTCTMRYSCSCSPSSTGTAWHFIAPSIRLLLFSRTACHVAFRPADIVKSYFREAFMLHTTCVPRTSICN